MVKMTVCIQQSGNIQILGFNKTGQSFFLLWIIASRIDDPSVSLLRVKDVGVFLKWREDKFFDLEHTYDRIVSSFVTWYLPLYPQEQFRLNFDKCKMMLVAALVIFISSPIVAQFYHGMHHSFGKNRLQYEEFNWQKMEFDDFTVFFYGKGKNLAVYTARNADQTISEVERFFDYPVRSERLQFVVYEKLEHFRQSNVGIPETDESNIGGVTQIAGNKIFVYFDGDLNNLRKQVRKGVSEVLIAQMLFGDNWREMIKNSALLNFPDWYIDGLTWYSTEPWSVEADDRLRDIVLSGRYKNFNRLRGLDSEIAGRSLWYYIGETYGSKVIPNIIYMARVSRNVESGFLFVLGISMSSLLEDAQEYFIYRYEQDAEGSQPYNDFVDVRTKRDVDYSELKSSDDGRYLAYASNDMSKTKLWILDTESGKRRGFLRDGHRLERVYDQGYPIIDWNEAVGRFMVIQERKGKIWLYQVDPKSGVETKTELLRLEKVLEMEVSRDGKQILFSAIANGQSDIYQYNIAARGQKQLTNDVFDDRYPSYWGDQIIFSSNRVNDTVDLIKDHLTYMPARFFDLYSLPIDGDENEAMRLTNTQLSSEVLGQGIDGQSFVYLSEESGIRNRYIGELDSTILSIDTTITYQYFAKTEPRSAYPRNIMEMDYDAEGDVSYEMLRYEGKYRIHQVESATQSGYLEPAKSNFRATLGNPAAANNIVQDSTGIKLIRHKVFDESDLEKVIIEPASEDIPIEPEPAKETGDDGLIDISNYTFEDEALSESKDGLPTPKQTVRDTANYTAVESFKVPEHRNYKLAFAATDVTTQFDFDYATDLYQPFNGGPYIMPGMGAFIKVGMLDVFEDYKLEGGFRYSFNGSGTEYFISLEDRSKRLDKKYIVQRQSLINTERTDSIQRTYLYQARGIFRYPLSDVTALQFTTTGRFDRTVTEAIEAGSLATPDRFSYYLGLKAEYIFDNTLLKALNIRNGARAKVFAEHYRDVLNPATGFNVVGLDARHYLPIHRDLIWANRIAGSSSFGQRKLVYYLGSVDNWIVLSQADRFNTATYIPRDEGYAFQTIATNMRGFIQNARNGNNFMVINSEIRWPIVRYFTDKPVKSEFISNFQIIGFADIGSAWNGPNPYSDDNSFNNIRVNNGSVTVTYKNQNDPIIGGTGWGLRTKVWGYFVRFDYAWGIENGLFLDPVTYLSFGLDF